MPEPTVPPADPNAQPVIPPVQPPAPEPTPPANAEHMIPKSRLDEVLEKNKNQEKELERLRKAEEERQKAQMSEVDRLKLEKETFEKKAAELESKQLRRDAAEKAGLPIVFADRLKGATQEELDADAKAFAEGLPDLLKKPTPPKLPPTNPNNADPNETDAQKRERLFGKQSNIFDIEAIRAGGGGVVISQKTKE